MAIPTVQHPGYRASRSSDSKKSESKPQATRPQDPDSPNPDPLTSLDHDLPSDFDFDIVTELSGPRRGLYSSKRSKTSDEVTQFTIYSLPSMVGYSCERLAPTIGGKTEPTTGTILSCCLYYGLSYISSSDAYKILLEVHSDLAAIDSDYDGSKVSEVRDLVTAVSSMPPGLNDVRSEKKNIWIPQWMMDGLSGVSKNLGMSSSIVSVMGILICLSKQPGLMEDHRKEMERAVSKFIGRLEVRSSMSLAAMEWLRKDKEES